MSELKLTGKIIAIMEKQGINKRADDLDENINWE